MKKMTPTQLRKDLYSILDQILESGEGIEIEREFGSVLLLPQRTAGKLERLPRRQTILGDVDSLDEISWEGVWQPDCF